MPTKLHINNDDTLERQKNIYKERGLFLKEEIDVHTRFVLFHHIDGGGDFWGGIDNPCTIPGPEGQVVHREPGCLIGQFQIQSTDVLATLSSHRLPGQFICPTCNVTKKTHQ